MRNDTAARASDTPPDAAVRFDAERWMEDERLRLVYANLPVVLLVTLGTALVLAWLLRYVVGVVHLLGWLGAGALITLLRFLDQRAFQRRAGQSGEPRGWRRRFGAGTLLSGLFWGYAGVVLFPSGELAHQVFIAFVLAGLSAGAMTAYAAVPRAYFAFTLPMLLPIIARFGLEGGSTQLSMMLLTLLFLAVIVRTAIQMDRMIGNVLRIRAENVELTRALQHQATHDPLVDLVNHREFSRRLKTMAKLAAARAEPYALLFIDLDEFKEVNDSGGHAAGDELLRRIGEILKRQIRGEDTAGRMGGDEFAVLLRRCPREQAERIAAKLLGAIEAFELDWHGTRFRVSASIGVAYTDAGEHDAGVVLRAADSACYAAKNAGRGRVEVYHADPVYETSGRFNLNTLQD